MQTMSSSAELLMVLKTLEGFAGPRIPVRVANRSGTTLIECSEPGAFLCQIPEVGFAGVLGPDAWLRGVFVPGEGAWFQLFDSLGTLGKEEIHLEEEAAQALLRRIG